MATYTKDRLKGGDGSNLYPITPWSNVFDPEDESRGLDAEITELENRMLGVEALAKTTAENAVAPIVEEGRRQIEEQRAEYEALIEHIDGSNLVTNIYDI